MRENGENPAYLSSINLDRTNPSICTQWCRFMGQEVREKRQGFGCNSARISPLRGQEFLVSISNFYPKFHVQRGGGLKKSKNVMDVTGRHSWKPPSARRREVTFKAASRYATRQAGTLPPSHLPAFPSWSLLSPVAMAFELLIPWEPLPILGISRSRSWES